MRNTTKTDDLAETDLRSVRSTLKEQGPLSHDELSDSCGYNWDEIQAIIRSLRNEGCVRITINRKYKYIGDWS